MKAYQFYVYMLKCSDESYYTGVTNNIEKRLNEHRNSKDEKQYVTTRRPFSLVLLEEFNDIRYAISREKQIKGWSRKKKEALIKQEWDELHRLAICRNWSNSDNASFDSAQDDIID